MNNFKSRVTAGSLFLATAILPASAITLVKDGQPAATIVVSKAALNATAPKPRRGLKIEPAQKARLAAEELQRVIEKMSGARLPIVGEDDAVQGPVVLVGSSRKTDPLKLDIPAGLTTERKEEGYLISAKGNTLVLAGNDAGPYQGTFFAVSEFLNRQGVRWFMPGAFGECVPKRASIDQPDLLYRDKPDFPVRSWNGNLAPELREDDTLWRLHNKLVINESDIIAIPGDGYLRKYMPDKELIETHPEYFAKRLDGTPDPHMVSLSNPETPRLVAEKVKAKIAEERLKDPTFNSLGFAPDDGMPIDLSKETMALNQGFADLCGREGVITERSISEEWFGFINKVAEEVVKDYPDFILTSNGYANRTFPPEGVALHPNLGIMFAAIWADLLHAYDDPRSWQQVMQGQMLQRWAQLCPRVFVYNYNFPMLVNCLTPLPLTRKIARNTPLMKKWGVFGFEDEQTFSWMAHGITAFYLRAKLYWHADDDARAILDDYFTVWYGPAAKPSQAYWEAIEEALESTPLLGHEDRILPYVYSDALLASMEKSQVEAEALATDEPFKTRVRVDRLILDHLRGYLAMNRAEFTGEYAAAIKQADLMFQQREQISAISGFFHVPESKDPRRRYFAGSHYWNLTQRREFYQKMLDRTTGTAGDLVARSERNVPFRLDDADLGRIGRWYDTDFDRSAWRKIDTATPFSHQGDGMRDARGVPYVGYMWYIFELDVPRKAIGKPVQAYAPVVTTEAWVWCNGEYVGHRPYFEAYTRPQPIDFDVTRQVKAGKNIIAVRVNTSASRIQEAEGFQGPLFLYSPKPPPPPAVATPTP
jgi:hypothetical protein